MEEIMDFLVDNYVYVAAISGFLIIVLLGVVISGSRKRKKEKEPDMVSISDVNTGTVNDVAMNLNMQNSMHMQHGVEPLKSNEVSSSVGNTMQNSMPTNNMVQEPISEVKPVSSLEPNTNNNTVNPINNIQGFVNPTMSNNVEPTMGPIPNFNQSTETPSPVSNVTPNVAPVMGSMNEQPNFVNEPVTRPMETNNSVNNVNESENIDIIDFSAPTGTTTSNPSGIEQNPLNGNEPNFNQNNNQGIL